MGLMERKQLHWSIGLVPPAWMLVQMIIMFSFMDTLFHGNRIWLALWIVEAVVTVALMIRWINHKVGPKTAQQKRWQMIALLWIVLCFVTLQIATAFNPSPNYSAIPGIGEAHAQAVMAASNAWSTRAVTFSITYAVVVGIGTFVLAMIAHRKMKSVSDAGPSTSTPT